VTVLGEQAKTQAVVAVEGSVTTVTAAPGQSLTPAKPAPFPDRSSS
jgi:hypothetical protein